mmetsp:Transcript_13057/g.17730  ORF Transcript_13057/g.17730 Transcript_13057/m.17730 type:complete len:234 (-) Transcript_13057:1600-2301(-)
MRSSSAGCRTKFDKSSTFIFVLAIVFNGKVSHLYVRRVTVRALNSKMEEAIKFVGATINHTDIICVIRGIFTIIILVPTNQHCWIRRILKIPFLTSTLYLDTMTRNTTYSRVDVVFGATGPSETENVFCSPITNSSGCPCILNCLARRVWSTTSCCVRSIITVNIKLIFNHTITIHIHISVAIANLLAVIIFTTNSIIIEIKSTGTLNIAHLGHFFTYRLWGRQLVISFDIDN